MEQYCFFLYLNQLLSPKSVTQLSEIPQKTLSVLSCPYTGRKKLEVI